jgi:CHAT domain-containing protein
MNKDFTVAAFKDQLAKEGTDGKRKFNVIHIASHFRLGSNWTNSFLLLGNGETLSLEDINDSPSIDFDNVDLVTLSACNTGFADDANGKEIDSLASVIQTKSGKAVLATLWPVADESTSMLMSEFYRIRQENPGITKAAAMQRAQVEMISGKLKASGAGSGCRSDAIDMGDGPQAFRCDPNAPFSHPYFWSPFVLIGNWR